MTSSTIELADGVLVRIRYLGMQDFYAGYYDDHYYLLIGRVPP